MGLFDTIVVKKKLPLSKELKKLKVKWDELDYQTKDLDNSLSLYEISKTGYLLYKKVEREWVDDEGSFLKGYMKEVSSEWIKTKHTGIVNFYTNFSTNPDNAYIFSNDPLPEQEEIEGDDWWVEFEGEFVRGKLINLELIEAKSTPAKIRILQHKEWEKHWQEKEKTIKHRIVKLLRKSKTYRKFISNLIKAVQYTSSKITWVLYRI